MAEITKPLIDPDKIIKEVFDVSKIDAKTELTSQQIEIISKGLVFAEVFNIPLMKEHLKSFMVLQKSKDRKSMAEFVDSLRNKKEDFIKNSKFSLMG